MREKPTKKNKRQKDARRIARALAKLMNAPWEAYQRNPRTGVITLVTGCGKHAYKKAKRYFSGTDNRPDRKAELETKVRNMEDGPRFSG